MEVEKKSYALKEAVYGNEIQINRGNANLVITEWSIQITN